MQEKVMSHRVDTSFTRYVFTPEEEMNACLFNDLQLQWLQNELALSAETKLALEVDSTNVTKFIQDEAFNAGKIQFIQYALQCHEDSVAKLKVIQAAQQSQPQ
jgi:hypothetical protein